MAWRWTSDGQGTFTVEPVGLDAAPARGTRVVLHLMRGRQGLCRAGDDRAGRPGIFGARADADPPPTRRRRGGQDARRRQRAVAEAKVRRQRSRVRRILRPCQPPVRRAGADHPLSRRRAERVLRPPLRPVNEAIRSVRSRTARADQALCRRVFITDEAKILPGWLRFMRGVIDSEDLPLNLSREMLQRNPVLEAIGKGVTSRILGDLDKLANDDRERYEKVWDAFGPVIKEGLYEDAERRDAIYKIAASGPRPAARRGGASPTMSPRSGRTRPRSTTPSATTQRTILASPQLEGFARRGSRGAGALGPGRRVLGAVGPRL